MPPNGEPAPFVASGPWIAPVSREELKEDLEKESGKGKNEEIVEVGMPVSNEGVPLLDGNNKP